MSEKLSGKAHELSDMQLGEVTGGSSTFADDWNKCTCEKWDDVEKFMYYHDNTRNDCPYFSVKQGEFNLPFCAYCAYFTDIQLKAHE